MASPSLPRIVTAFPDTVYDELAATIKGQVFRPSETEFFRRSMTFNGKIIPRPRLVVSPLDAEDVSTIVKFCLKHNLSPSVRAGGYAIAGWAVAGDIVIDLSLIKVIDIEPPVKDDEGKYHWTRLRDMPELTSKGKSRAAVRVVATDSTDLSAGATVDSPATRSSVKRRREDDIDPQQAHTILNAPIGDRVHRPIPSYDSASQALSAFLHGPPLPQEDGETPRQPPTNRRRLDSPEPEGAADTQNETHTIEAPALEKRQTSSQSSTTSSGLSPDSISRSLSTTTAMTSPLDAPSEPGLPAADPPAAIPPQASSSPFDYMSAPVPSRPSILGGGDPFGYMSGNSAAVGMSMPMVPPLLPNIGSSTGSFFRPVSGSRPPVIPPGFPPTAGPFTIGQAQMGSAAPPRPIHTHAYVTFGAGVLQKDVDLYTSENPLEGVSGVTGETEERLVPYHVPSSAHPVGSSPMLLSGFGFLSRLHGLSSDSLVEVEMVLADGRIVVVSEEDDPDLWWAIRGAGPAFGIVTRYKAKAYPVPIVFAGNLVYRFHRATAPSLIKHFRDCIKGVPRELYANVLLTAGPANQDSLVVIQMCYLGPKEDGQKYLDAIASWDGERCLLNEVSEKSFLHQQDSVAQVLRGKPGRQWFLRSSLIHSLPDEVIHNTVLQFADTPIGCTWIFELSGGAIADFEDNCLPKEQREAMWTIAALHQWDMGIDDPRCVTTAEDWMRNIIKPISVGGPFPVFIGRHEPVERVKASFGKNWDRLVSLKKKYDPEHLFRNNFWPLDKVGYPVESLYNEPPSPIM